MKGAVNGGRGGSRRTACFRLYGKFELGNLIPGGVSVGWVAMASGGGVFNAGTFMFCRVADARIGSLSTVTVSEKLTGCCRKSWSSYWWGQGRRRTILGCEAGRDLFGRELFWERIVVRYAAGTLANAGGFGTAGCCGGGERVVSGEGMN